MSWDPSDDADDFWEPDPVETPDEDDDFMREFNQVLREDYE